MIFKRALNDLRGKTMKRMLLILSLVLFLSVGVVNANTELFVTVGNNGQVGYSSDGINWTEGGSGTIINLLEGIAWSPELELFVAVGGIGQVGYSSDGINWTDGGTSTFSNRLEDVVWSPELELFVAVGSNGQVGYSSDGITWTDGGTSTISNTLRDVAWSPELELFVAVGDIGQVGYSSDGINWTDGGTGTFSNRLWGVAWSPELELFVTVGEQIGYSSDGINWTDGGTSTFENILYAVAFSTYTTTTTTFEITAIDTLTTTAIQEFSVIAVDSNNISDSRSFNTTNGTIITDIDTDSGEWDLTLSSNGYYNTEYLLYDASTNLEGSLNPITYFTVTNITDNTTNLTILEYNVLMIPTGVGATRNFSTTNGTVITDIENLDPTEYDITISSDGYVDKEFNAYAVNTNIENETLTPEDSILTSLFDDITIPLNTEHVINLDNNMIAYRYEIEVYYITTQNTGEGVTLGDSTGIYNEITNRYTISLEDNLLLITPLTQPHSFAIRVTGYNINDVEGDSDRFNIESTAQTPLSSSIMEDLFSDNFTFILFIILLVGFGVGAFLTKNALISLVAFVFTLFSAVVLYFMGIHLLIVITLLVVSFTYLGINE